MLRRHFLVSDPPSLPFCHVLLHYGKKKQYCVTKGECIWISHRRAKRVTASLEVEKGTGATCSNSPHSPEWCQQACAFSECLARNDCLTLQANKKNSLYYLLLTFITFPPELNLRMATEKCKTVIRVVIILLQKS